MRVRAEIQVRVRVEIQVRVRMEIHVRVEEIQVKVRRKDGEEHEWSLFDFSAFVTVFDCS